MCGIVDDILPIAGAVLGTVLIPGVGTALGAGIGGAIGGGISGWVQNHNLAGLGMGAVTGGVGGALSGGSLASALGGLGSAGVGAASAGFDTGLASSVAPATLGSLESGAGGAAMFGANAGTGTAIGSAAGALGGGGLGIAGGDALSGVGSAGLGYLGGLGGGYQGTGLGVGGQAGSQADLVGAQLANAGTGGSSGLATPATNQGITPTSPTASLANNSATGITPGGTTTSSMGSNVLEGSQAAQAGGAAQSGGLPSMEGSQAAMVPGGDQGALAAMYGPTSTSAGSPIGQGIANTSVEVPGANGVQFGALGEGTSSAPGIAGNTASAAATGTGTMDQLSNLYQQASPWMTLAKTGLGAYQQYAQQQAQNAYANQINNMFAPNSPYAQQMEQTLARQDAAAGRNSQYGNRAVQLAAALTQARANALGNANYYHAATATPGANMLNSLFANYAANPQAFNQMGSAALNGLSSLFGG